MRLNSRPMGKIVKRLKVVAGKKSKECEILLDSGASASIVRKDVVDELGVPVETLDRPMKFREVDGRKIFSTSEVCILQIRMKGKLLNYFFM